MVQSVSAISQARLMIKQWKAAGLTVGFVPTMGYLHEGHQSLMEKAREQNDKVVVSIFVNPMQFGPTEDLAQYPRDFEHDSQLCEASGVDLIFHPNADEIYSPYFSSYIDINRLGDKLCGKSRPNHFRGVCTVVGKLFNIIQPDNAYFGQKDAQQLAIIERMVSDLNFDINIVGCPIIREQDGLAKSSRNSYLNKQERQAALCLYRAITLGQQLVKQGEKNTAHIIAQMQAVIEHEPLARIDYISMVELDTLKPVNRLTGKDLCAMAVYIGKTRLIDNFMIKQHD